MNTHFVAALHASGAHHIEHQRQIIGADQPTAARHFLDQTGHHFGDVLLFDILKRPKALHPRLVTVVSTVGRIKGADDGKHLRIFGLERCGQCRCRAMLGTGNDLPLIDQIGIAPQGRCAPCISGHANAGMWQSFGAHANFDTRRHAGLASVNGRHAQTSKPLPPSAVGQDHGFCHDQIEWRAALPHTDLHRLVARWGGVAAVTQQAEVVVGPVEVFGLAANHFTACFQMLGQAPEECQALVRDGQ